jgi:hypothetical protein
MTARKKATKKTARATGAVRKAKTGGKAATAGVTTTTLINMIPKSLSGETHQDSEPHLTVNPSNPLQIAATAFTPNPGGGALAPLYVSVDGGNTWVLNPIVPSSTGSQTGTFDITTSFGADGQQLYGGILRAPTGNLEFLRTATFSGSAPMTVLASRPNADQPFTHATTVPSGPDAGKDRVYVGDNDFNATPKSATLDESLNGKATAAVFTSVRVEKRTTAGQDGPQTRPASHPDGTVYSAFYRWRSLTGSFPANTLVVTSADLVVVRDDNGGLGATPFTSLIDPGDATAGLRVVQGISFPFNRNGTSATGQQRVGGSVSIAVDPKNSSNVWIAWGDAQPGSFLTLHVRRSTDRGKTWGTDLLTVPNACNGALAITQNGVIGLLSQQLLSGSTWVTSVRFTTNGTQWAQVVLSTGPAGTPAKTFDPYLGDYDHMLAVGKDFYGIFSASNSPDMSHFPQGVKYLRNANFTTKTLLSVNNVTPVAVSIDPFFFKLTPNPCQALADGVDDLAQQIQDLIDALDSGEIPPPPRTPAKIAAVRAQIAKMQVRLRALELQLTKCQQLNP